MLELGDGAEYASGRTMSRFVLGGRMRRDYSIASTELFVESGVRFRDVVAAVDEMGQSANIEGSAMYMHGFVSVTEEDEKIVQTRTLEWQESLR